MFLEQFIAAVRGLLQAPGDLFVLVPAAWLPLAILALRSLDQGIATLRMLVTSQGRALVAWILALLQALVFLAAISGVLSQLNNPWNIIAFAAGNGMGTVIGLLLDNWSAAGHAMIKIVSPTRGGAVLDRLRELGYGATEIPGQGKDGTVTIIYSTVPRRHLARARQAVLQVDPLSFATTEAVQVLSGGSQP